MGYRHALLVLSIVLLGSLAPACGKEIGDACQLSSDCSPNGDRLCDPDPQSPGGYCTVQGCDYNTCPDEAVCVRFFLGQFANPMEGTEGEKTCPADVACTLDELCSVSGHCVARSSEVRYCMKTCDSNDDCRDEYECRDFDKMKEHGGEPVLAPGRAVDASAPKFCAIAPK